LYKSEGIMKKWLFIFTLIFGALSLKADEPTSQEASTWVIGSQWIQEIREEYQNGSYRQIFEDLEKEYQKGMSERQVRCPSQSMGSGS